MFNRILGKREMEECIQYLEAQITQQGSDIDSLSKRLAAKEEAARKAVSQKQIVEEELNSAKKKIETLEHEISALRQETVKEPTFRNIGSISKQSLETYVFQIGSIRTLHKTLITVYLSSGKSLSELENGNELLEYLGPEIAGLVDKMASSTGVAVFYDTGQIVREALAPFLPVNTCSWQLDNAFNTRPLHAMTEKEPNILALIVHAGESFMGITGSSESFTDQKIVRSQVKAKHTKGGWSQRRFERLRDVDIQHHVEKVVGELKVMVGRSNEEIDLIIAGGESRMVYDILQEFNYPVVERSFNVSVDKKNVDKILKEVWSSRRYEI